MKRILKKIINKYLTSSLNEFKNEFIKEVSENTLGLSKVSQILLKLKYKELLSKDVNLLPSFDDVGFRTYSQFEEDGILLYLFSILGTTNKKVVEVCAGNGIECNSTNLIINHGWNGFLFDGDAANVKIGKIFFDNHKNTFLWPPKFICSWITAENINEIIHDVGCSGEVDLLSLDIDGNDYWVWKVLDCIKPRVVVCETHNVIPFDKALTIPYDPKFKMTIPDYHSASLLAMTKLAKEKGYRLVGTHRYGFNAFFVRNDVGAGIVPEVSVESCLQDSYTKDAVEKRWPKVKDLNWVEV